MEVFLVRVSAFEVWERKVKLMFCAVLTNIRKSTALFKGSQALPVCLSDKNSIKMKTVWSNGGMILTGETEVMGEKHYIAWVVGE
jgi:hypothetical protein